MKRKAEYLRFVDNHDRASNRKTRCVEVISHRSSQLLGRIEWWPAWRQYVFFPEQMTLWNHDCLKEISKHCEQMTIQHKEKRRMEQVNGE